jgi:23S rRNA U2552 (ribose-2'-O)-methylase RlmE/FtsJ
MVYYQLPPTHPNTYKSLCVSNTPQYPTEIVSFSLSRYLFEIKNKITPRDKDWDVYKKYTNTYEYIHSLVPYKKKSVSKYKPLSRSYFKMIEIINTFNLVPNSSIMQNKYFNVKPPTEKQTPPIKTFHLAEGPGGFIEAVVNMRNNPNDMYFGMTIVDDIDDGTIPSWNKSNHFLKLHENVILEYGEDGTGDLLCVNNFMYCYAHYGASIDFITADGGFDFSTDFLKQEVNITKLLFAQICYALCMQKKGGSFVLKIFDVFHAHTIDMLYLLSSMYQTVYITKPQTSRSGNSEKYVVCKGFLHKNASDFFEHLFQSFSEAINTDSCLFISRLLNLTISSYFKTKIEECNSVFGQQQIENIHYTLSLIDKNIKSDKINLLIKNNITKCINWCIKYNIPYNNLNNNNIFLSGFSDTFNEQIETVSSGNTTTYIGVEI